MARSKSKQKRVKIQIRRKRHQREKKIRNRLKHGGSKLAEKKPHARKDKAVKVPKPATET